MIRQFIHQCLSIQRWRAIGTLGLLMAFAAVPAEAQHVHQLYYNNSTWSDQFLDGAQVGQYAAPLLAYPTTPNEQRHVYYAPTDGHIHQLFFNGSTWADEDLTIASGGIAKPYGVGQFGGFSVGNYQYVFYYSTDLHVHQLLYNNLSWVDTDLTHSASSSTTVSSIGHTGVVAFSTSPALHVYYLGSDNHIHQLYSPDTQYWIDQDLTLITMGNALLGNILLRRGFSNGAGEYVYWDDSANGHAHQLAYLNGAWADSDLSAATGVVPTIGIESALALPGTQNIRLYCRDTARGEVFELSSTNNGGWTVTTVIPYTGAGTPYPDQDVQLLAFATTPNNAVHLFFVHNSQMYQAFEYSQSPELWSIQNLGFSVARGDGFYMSGFSVQNLQYVYFLGH